jgi:hypothetical protein
VVRVTAPSRPLEALGTLQAALAYLDLGWSVIPAPVGAKRALVPWKRYQEHRPTPAEWQTWARRWPRANLAVITGRLSRVIVVDVDPRHGGLDTIYRLARDHGGIPDTTMSITPSGGRHLYFRHPGGRVANSQGLLGPGVDVRGDGGLALLPPSRRADGERYEWWEGPDSLEPIPPWMVALLRPRPATANATKTAATTRPDDQRVAARWEAILRRVSTAQEGSRNTWTYWAACRLAELDLDPATRDRLAGDLEELAVNRGLPRGEAQRTIASALGVKA